MSKLNNINNISYKISLSLILFGGLHLLALGFNFNLINFITKNYKIDRYIYLLIGLMTLYVLTLHYRKLYLSFLEETVMPPSVFNNKINKYNDKKITINLEEGKKVIYWSAKSDKNNQIMKNWKDAYDTYDNSGIVDIIGGKAELTYSTPVQYRVGNFNRLLPRHLHYRILYEDGVLSKIYTINLI
jgi:hypothetical protein